MHIHLLTLNWNGKDKLEKLAPSLFSALSNINFTWHIKDNASKDNSIDYLKQFSNTNVIAYKDNRQNFSEGCNFLFKEANPSNDDYIMLLNNDVIFNDTISIHNMLSIIQNDPEVGVVGARLLYTNTTKLQHAGVVFNPTYKTPMHFRAGQKSDQHAEKNRLFQAVTGAVLITKAEYYQQICTTNKSKINGMDEKFSWAFDDVDLCLSIKYNLNKKIVYCGNTNIYHEESASLKKNQVNKLFLTNNLSYLFQKWQSKYNIDQNEYTKEQNYNLYKKNVTKI